MKNKIVNVVFKKFQSYSFIIFLALVLGAFFALSQLNNNDHKTNNNVPAQNSDVDNDNDNDDDTVDLSTELFKLPLSSEEVTIARNYYDPSGTTEEQLNAIVKVNNYYFMNKGVNYTIDNETPFDVLASLSGTVTKVTEDSLRGNYVEVEHLYGVKTVYFSLATVNVAVGDEISQGDVIGTAGESNFDADSGVHVHFEVLNNGVKMNPNDLIGTKISDFESNE